MIKFEEYANRYRNIKMERRDGILQMTVHTDGNSLRWTFDVHEELPEAFWFVGQDRDNKVIILTGTGDEFSGPAPTPDTPTWPARPSAQFWDKIYWDAKALLNNLLSIEVPMIGAVNGPALRHCELPLLCDIVLAAEEAAFQDSGHFMNAVVPGDGMHIVFPLLLGANRGRYFLLTGQKLNAKEAKDLGLVSEVLPRDKLLARAWEHAENLAKLPLLHLRYSRLVLVEDLKRRMQDLLAFGLSLEGMALMERGLPEKTS
ncbi:MAG TPA: enoyl-CoA hydratase/isomerase family protein [Pseudolabrys sp.]|nr:enoyl-CoA hydratase/isomerase family protein [Pseudolabrys sp.]